MSPPPALTDEVTAAPLLSQQTDPSRRRGLPAWLMSGALHLSVLMSLAVLTRATHRGAAVEPDRSGGIVLVQQGQGKPQYLSEGETSTVDRPAASSAANPLPGLEQLPADPAGILPQPSDLVGVGGELGQGLPDASGFTSSGKPSRQLGGYQVQTGVFGVTGTGSKFVYVFDRSASMEGFEGRPLAAAKAQLIASLKSLEKVHQFQIIFYNDQTSILNPLPSQPPRMMYGDEQTKKLAENYIRGVVADGGTRHYEPLMMALRLQPDVIFFLTDATERPLSASELERIRRRNQRIGASINTIEFGVGRAYDGGARFLRKLASDNGGKHVYVDVSALPEG